MPLVAETRLPSGQRKIRPEFHPGQRRAWASGKRIVAVVAGVRSGKTSFAAFWLWREMQRKGPGDYLVAAPNFPLIDKAAGPEIQALFERHLRLGVVRTHPWQLRISPAGHRRLWPGVPLDRPSRIIFGHADDPDSLEAMTVKAAWLDECGQKKFRLASWEAVRARLSIDRGRALLTSRPYGLGWLKQHVYDPWRAAGGDHPDIDVIRFDSTENPAFPKEEFDKARAELPAWKFNMMYRARFERPAGLVYDSFDTSKHVVAPFAVPDKWPRYLGLDFGGVNTCAVYFARDIATGTLYLYREYYPRAARTAAEHVRAILAGSGPRPVAVGGSHSEGQWRSEFAAAGLGVSEPAVREVDVGIGRVYAAFAADKVRVFSSCTRWLEEAATYSYACDEAGNPLGTGEIEDKRDYHCFPAGTMVETAEGSTPIELIRPGTLVLTRRGYFPALACHERPNQPMLTMELDNGIHLTGTANHPICVGPTSFVRLDSLRYNDGVITLSEQERKACREGRKESGGRRFRLMGSLGFATPIHREWNCADTLAMAQRGSTDSSGNFTMAKFRRGTTSTTRTGTRATTTYPISNCCPPGIMQGFITRGFARPESGRILIASATLLPPGTQARRGSSGTASTGGTSWLQSPWSHNPVSGVGNSTSPGASERPTAFVPTTAGRRRGGPVGLTTSSGFVRPVSDPLPSTATRGPGVALARVRKLYATGRGTVYNLTVAGDPEYFANGVLVHNCLDATRYIIGWLERPGATAAVGSSRRSVIDDLAAKGIWNT